MSIGGDVKIGAKTYVTMFKETTYGTYPVTVGTGAAWLEPISVSFKTEIKSEKLETLGNRGFTKRVMLDKTVSGGLEQYLHPQESPLLFAVAMGKGIVSSSISGGFLHSLSSGDFDTTPSSLSFNVKKGDLMTFGYTGGRVNSLKLSGKVGEPVKVSYDFIFKDSTTGVSDLSGVMSLSSVLPYIYTGGVYRYTSTEASLTSTVEEKILGFELEINNNLKADADSRQLGQNTIAVLPATKREVKFKISQRFDTTTTYDRFTQGTVGAAELIFTGDAISTPVYHLMTVRLPKLYYNSLDTAVGSASDILKAEINFDVLVDTPNTSTGRDVGITFQNNIATY